MTAGQQLKMLGCLWLVLGLGQAGQAAGPPGGPQSAGAAGGVEAAGSRRAAGGGVGASGSRQAAGSAGDCGLDSEGSLVTNAET